MEFRVPLIDYPEGYYLVHEHLLKDGLGFPKLTTSYLTKPQCIICSKYKFK